MEHQWQYQNLLLAILPYIVMKIFILIASFTTESICIYYLDAFYLLLLACLLIMIGSTMMTVAYVMHDTTSSYLQFIVGVFFVGWGLGWMTSIWIPMAKRGMQGFSSTETWTYTFITITIAYYLNPIILGNIASTMNSLKILYGINVLLILFGTMPCIICLPYKYYATFPHSTSQDQMDIAP
jgi:hypothetical protein